MLEISPVLAGTFDQPDYVPASSNINATPAAAETNDSSAIDASRRYSKFDRSASQVGDADMSFSDFIDMINPLQHIPMISSVYRAITGDSINPVSRVAGDILYGGAFGVVGAVAGGMGAVADSVMEAETGKDVTGAMIANLFGDGGPATSDNQPTLLAAANPATGLAPPTPASTASQPQTGAVESQNLPVLTAEANAVQTAAFATPAVRNKLPYGGALAPRIQNFHNENLKMAVSNATGGLRIGNTIYSSQVKKGARMLPATPPAQIAAAPNDTLPTATPAPVPPSGPVVSALPADAGTTISSVNPTPLQTSSDNSIPKDLRDDALIMKALGLYQNSASYSSGATSLR